MPWRVFGAKSHNAWATPQVLVDFVVDLTKKMVDTKRWTIIDPSVGPDAPFLCQFDPKRSFGIDIDRRAARDAQKSCPKHRVLIQDFLTFKPSPRSKRRFAVVGNPPYGTGRGSKAGNIALKFIEHALTFADLVILLVGQNMRKVGTVDRVRNGRLVREYVVPRTVGKFRDMKTGIVRTMGTTVQVWARGRPRPTTRFISSMRNVTFLPRSRIDEANVLVRRFGSRRSTGQVTFVRGTAGFRKRFLEVVSGTAATPADFAVLAKDPKAFAERVWRCQQTIRDYIEDSSISTSNFLTRDEFITLLTDPKRMKRPWTTHYLSK